MRALKYCTHSMYYTLAGYNPRLLDNMLDTHFNLTSKKNYFVLLRPTLIENFRAIILSEALRIVRNK